MFKEVLDGATCPLFPPLFTVFMLSYGCWLYLRIIFELSGKENNREHDTAADTENIVYMKKKKNH